MTIKSHTGPSDGEEVMLDALALIMSMEMLPPLRGKPQYGSPVPTYYVPLDKILSQDPLAHAEIIGWQYPIIGSIEPGLVDIRGDEGISGASFGGISYGTLAQRFIEASILADEKLDDTTEEFEPRFLNIPSLDFSALWLEGSKERYFISLLDGDDSEGDELKMVDDIMPELKARASERGQTSGHGRAARDAGFSDPTN